MFETCTVRPLAKTMNGRLKTVCKSWQYFWYADIIIIHQQQYTFFLCLILSCRIVFLLVLFSRVNALSYHECVESRLFDTAAQGRYVCSTHSDLVPALQLAERVGREECEKAFKDDAWNCSGFSVLKAPNVTSRSKKYVPSFCASLLLSCTHVGSCGSRLIHNIIMETPILAAQHYLLCLCTHYDILLKNTTVWNSNQFREAQWIVSCNDMMVFCCGKKI